MGGEKWCNPFRGLIHFPGGDSTKIVGQVSLLIVSYRPADWESPLGLGTLGYFGFVVHLLAGLRTRGKPGGAPGEHLAQLSVLQPRPSHMPSYVRQPDRVAGAVESTQSSIVWLCIAQGGGIMTHHSLFPQLFRSIWRAGLVHIQPVDVGSSGRRPTLSALCSSRPGKLQFSYS